MASLLFVTTRGFYPEAVGGGQWSAMALFSRLQTLGWRIVSERGVMTQELRVLFQPPNGTGLGHISRQSAIARAFIERYEEARVLFFTTPKAGILLDRYKLPYVSYPQTYKAEAWKSWPDRKLQALLRESADAVVRSFVPHAVVFDCYPNEPLFRAAQRARIPIAVCVREHKHLERYLNDYGPYLDAARLILVPHPKEEFDLPARYEEKTRHVGPILRKMLPREESENPFPSRPAIAICAGGGGAEGVHRFFELASKAFQIVLQTQRDASAVVVAGPLFSDWYSLPVVDGMRLVPSDPFIERLYFHADLVVCECGYNTMTELETMGVPAVCLPAYRVFDSQETRAERLASRSPNLTWFRGTTPAQLAETICAKLASPAPQRRTPQETSGADMCAVLVRELLPGRISAFQENAVSAWAGGN